MLENLDFTEDDEKTNKYISKNGVHKIRVREFKYSLDIDGYNKTPFIKFIVEDLIDSKETGLMFWLPTKKDTEEKLKLKTKLIKEFFINLCCDISTIKGRKLIEDSINKTCQVVLREKERIYYKKDTKKPIIIKELEYYYSGKSDETLIVNESKLYLPLFSKYKEQFDKELKDWEELNTPNNEKNNSIEEIKNHEEDLPF